MDNLTNEISETSELSERFNAACENGDVNTLRGILRENPGVVDLESNDGYGFKKACENGHVNVIDYLIKTNETVKNISLDFQENIGFFIACNHGQSEIIKYYFEHKSYQLKPGLINNVFIKSCELNNMDMHKVLLNFNLFKDINPKWNKWQGFKTACKNEMNEMISDIVFKLDMELTDDLKDWLKKEQYERVLNTFKKREIYRSLK